MKRRFFIVSTLGSLAVASSGAAPALAQTVREASFQTVRVDRRTGGASPGGCSSFRRASPHGGYTLPQVLSGKFGR